MRRRHEVFGRILFGAGVAAVFIGVATIVYAMGFLGSRVSSLTEALSQSLTTAQRGLSILESTAVAFQASPEVLDHMKATLRQSATALRSSAVTMREVRSPTGLIIPGESLEESASELEGTATELDRLAEDIGAIQDEASVVDIPPVRVVLADLQRHLGDTEEALSQAPAARGAVALTILQGGIYILLGVLALALSGVIGRIERVAGPDDFAGRA